MEKIRRKKSKGLNPTEALISYLVPSQITHHENLNSNTRSLRKLIIKANLEYSLVDQDVVGISTCGVNFTIVFSFQSSLKQEAHLSSLEFCQTKDINSRVVVIDEYAGLYDAIQIV